MSDHTGNQIRGFKATISNPNTSEEAKQHAREKIEELEGSSGSGGADAGAKGGDSKGNDDEHDHRVLGGYKATLKNEQTSEEAKKHAREELKKAGVEYEE